MKGRRSQLWIVGVATTFPIAILVTVGLLLYGNQHAAAVQQQLLQAAYGGMDAVDHTISADLLLLDQLALDAQLFAGDLSAFHRKVSRLLAGRPHWRTVVLTDRQGRVLDSSQAPGAPPLDLPLDDPGDVAAVLGTGHPSISGVRRANGDGTGPGPSGTGGTGGTGTGEPVLVLRVPVGRNDATRTLAAVISARGLGDQLRLRGVPAEMRLALVDAGHRLIARTASGQDSGIGALVPPATLSGLEREPGSRFTTTTFEGLPMLAVAARSARTGWAVVAGMPSAVLVWEARWSLLLAVAGSVAALVVALAITAALVRAQLRRLDADRERHALEVERRTERRLADIAAYFPGVIYRRELRPDGRMAYTYLSPGHQSVVGLNRVVAELNDWQPLDRLIESMPREARLGWLTALRRSAETLTPFMVESAFTMPDGNVRWVRSTAGVHRRGDGTVVWDGVALDITQLKRAEGALATGLREAEQANRATRRLLTAADRDLRQTFVAMSLFSGLLVAQLDGDRRRALAARLDEGVRTGLELLNALFDLSAGRPGIPVPDIGPVAVGDLLERLKREFAPLALARGVPLRVVPSTAVVASDPLLLHRLLRNLLLDALHAGGGGRVLIGCRRQGAMLRIEVWDSGPEIPPARLDAVFEDYGHPAGPEPANHHARRLGLALAMVRRLANRLGHRLGVRSLPGLGSALWVAAALVDGPAQAARPPPGRLHRILLVEEEDAQRTALRLTLESWGHTVWAAADGDGALALVRGGGPRPTLLICDTALPGGMSTTALVARIHDVLGDAVPAILLTDGEEAPPAPGVCHQLVRPFHPEDLGDAIALCGRVPT